MTNKLFFLKKKIIRAFLFYEKKKKLYGHFCLFAGLGVYIDNVLVIWGDLASIESLEILSIIW